MHTVNIRNGEQCIGSYAHDAYLEVSQGMYIESDLLPIGKVIGELLPIAVDTMVEKQQFKMPDDLSGLVTWMQRTVEEFTGEDDAVFSKKSVAKANELGAFCSVKQIYGRYGSFTQFYEAHDLNTTFTDMRRYGDFSLSQAISVARKIVKETGRRPRVQDYEAMHQRGICPSGQYMVDHFGIARLAEAVGYVDTQCWDAEEYVDWTVRVMEVNGRIDTHIIETLAGRQVGPNRTTLTNTFGSIDALRMRAEAVIAEKGRRLGTLETSLREA
jgi:hypothetical protein